MNIPNDIKTLAVQVSNHGGRLFVVGGAVRDWIMGIEPLDFDLLIVGLPLEMGLAIMGNPPQVVGTAPVFMWGDTEVAFARKEISTGTGKHAFEFVADASVTLIDDLRRRDFTINSMAFDIIDGVVIDPFWGQSDIFRRLLHPTGVAFKESPERVLRGATFAARFDFHASQSFVTAAQEMFEDFTTIPAEQIWRHWEKMCKLAAKPSSWLRVMLATGWTAHFPALSNLIGVEQDPIWHPEGDVLDHAMFVMDMAAQIADERGVDRIWAITTALLHDVGKAVTTTTKEGRVVSPGHAEAGVPIARKFLQQMCAPNRFTERVLEGIALHMRHLDCNTHHAARRLLADMGSITLNEFFTIVMADHNGRGSDRVVVPQGLQFLMESSQQQGMTGGFTPVIMGRHLIELGLRPGKQFGIILNRAKEAQIEGTFDNLDDGLTWLREQGLVPK